MYISFACYPLLSNNPSPSHQSKSRWAPSDLSFTPFDDNLDPRMWSSLTGTLGYVAPSLLLFLFFYERLALAGLFVPISIFGPGGLLSGVQGSALSSSIGDSSSVGCILKLVLHSRWRWLGGRGMSLVMWPLLGCRHLG